MPSGRWRTVTLADELAKQQRSISVAEFFEKNKHLLGFDSPTRGIVTTIKEAVDNALDACEESGILPDIYIRIQRTGGEVVRIVVEDNGPGIIPEQIPYVFGKLLYGSRFHQIRQSRGQQGIGISAAVLYAQLTTGMPAVIVSRTGGDAPAHRFALQIDIATNEPVIVSRDTPDWDRTHGTRVQIEFKSTLAAKKRLIDYLKYSSVVNPHARIQVELDDEQIRFERVSSEAIACTQAIQPHPHGIEIGQLMRMASASGDTIGDFLVKGFSRVGKKTAEGIASAAGLSAGTRVRSLSPEELKRLLAGMQAAKIPAPPASQCLSPIGEELIRKGLEKEFQMDFVSARTRPPSVFSGHPFMVEAAVGYGGKLPAEGNAMILRFANRVPLMYQQGACAITGSIARINWKGYGVSTDGLPGGPLLVLVHVASTNVPFTSESKDAVAGIPEIEREIVLALQDLGRDLKTFLSRRDKSRIAEDRARAVCAIIPEISAKVGEIVELPPPDISSIEGRIMKRLVVKKRTSSLGITLEANNYTSEPAEFSLYFSSRDEGGSARPRPDFVSRTGTECTLLWKVRVGPGEQWMAVLPGQSAGTVDIRDVMQNRYAVVELDE